MHMCRILNVISWRIFFKLTKLTIQKSLQITAQRNVGFIYKNDKILISVKPYDVKPFCTNLKVFVNKYDVWRFLDCKNIRQQNDNHGKTNESLNEMENH